MAEPLPLFPLSHVLLPGMPLPLHIFEQRYRDLVDDVEHAPGGQRFGVVALRTGTEAATRFTASDGSGAADIETIGTVAEILEIDRRPDGTSDLLAVGSRRFRVRSLVTEGRAYLRAEVDFLDEPDGDLTPAQETRARELMEVYDAILRKLAGRGTGGPLPDEAAQLSYHLAARLPLPPAEKQALLAEDTTAARLVRVRALLRREIALLRGTRSIAVAPTVLRIATGIN